ncbi:MAG: hypothetical protein EPO63_02160 [Candidatus Nitrosotenuis sp.]|nr:MAG: hypothetical protein EPO63_02160 [Candidatus Nitrosotenuis sp.]
MQILNLDENVRFVGIVKYNKLVSFAKRKDWYEITNEISGVVHHQASKEILQCEMSEDDDLGITNWMITSKEFVKMMTIFLENGMLIISSEPNADHDSIINKIKTLNIKF